ncbi:HK97-gp10 family putative phage morphogenesis protein [Clostridium gasigenes]|uniref:HK97 gp10 family phage protein n=1 Tax=Clostridium gasigenes TaxID=94869 RepID=A0A7X0SF26_9CLOT|nr:HK97-gp10 family putative phage morphogenesis protein [Clostridium gasigenes]MBB6716365.1 HK97 gp10 family phage protein [Clostridium gasigenes]
MAVSQIVGLDKLMAKLTKLGGNVDLALEKGIKQATKQVQATAKELCPVDTNELRGSIVASTKKDKSGTIGKVSTNCAHAVYMEFGTGQKGEASPSPPKSHKDVSYREDWKGVKAQPYLYPALTSNKDNIQRILEHNIQGEISKLRK